MGSFFSDTFLILQILFKYTVYVYAEAASTTVAPSISTLSRIYCTLQCTVHVVTPTVIKNISDNSFLTRLCSVITQSGCGGRGR
jgi:hypothetical protein